MKPHIAALPSRLNQPTRYRCAYEGERLAAGYGDTAMDAYREWALREAVRGFAHDHPIRTQATPWFPISDLGQRA